MAKAKAFRVIIATDGSDHARAAIATAIHFPWPAETRVRVVAARKTRAEYRQSILLSALDRSADAAAENARRMLSRRWPDVEAVVVDKVPVDAVLGEADRFAADVIVLGWRGHGAIRRLLMGSVSRGVMRSAKCAVLVVRRALRFAQDCRGLRRLCHVETRARVCRQPDGARWWPRDPRDRRRVDAGAVGAGARPRRESGGS
jgi:nucleotide-binding universal stress UspA family protein